MTQSPASTLDVIDQLLGLEPGSKVSTIRYQFSQNRQDFQAYYDSLFNATKTSLVNLDLESRLLLAARTAVHTSSTSVVNWYVERARDVGVNEGLISAAVTVGSNETGDRALDAALAHADLLVTRPVEATRADLEKLENAGISAAGIVTLSQVVAFVSYQLRFVSLIRVVGEL